jgi:hypothetical protein
MTQHASLIRKVVYIGLMAVLLIPLSLLSQPSVINPTDASKNSAGGVLAQQRTKYRLAESEIGEIDPTSETMKLATLGMRGVACTILWQQANEAKMKENWDAFAAVLRQISKLQPHFINVWVFQSWNMSYNVSVEFDDYRYRYHWVKKGIDYLTEGTKYNQRDVRLLWHLGWVFGHKFGRSDETVQFRRLFQQDDDFHKSIPIDYNSPSVQVRDYEGRIDNWLVSREFFLRAQQLVDRYNVEKLGQSPVIFHSEPAMARMNYAEAIEEEGYFGERAGLAWKQASDEWREFGNRRIPTSYEGIQIELNEQESTAQRAADLAEQLDKLVAGVREKLLAEKREKLTPAERAAIDTPEADRNSEQHTAAAQARDKLEVTHQEVAEHAPPEIRDKAARLAAQVVDLEARARIIESYRQIVNFVYWRTRAESEQTPTMVDAHRLVYEAQKAYDEARLVTTTDPATGKESPGAKELYEEAFANWAEVFEKYPLMLENPETEDLLEHVGNYRSVLDQLDQTLPADFALYEVIRLHDREGKYSASLPPKTVQATPTDDDPRAAMPRPPVPRVEGEQPTAETRPNNDPAPTGDDPRAVAPQPPVPPSE